LAYYLASDIHLRDDHPERAYRFCNWLGQLKPDDDLVIIGDLCDFWMAARYSERQLAEHTSLAALADFRRGGGSLSIMAGNHDAWICPFYERELGARILAEPYDMVVHGLRVRLVHGHRLGARRAWKAGLESRAFFRVFGRLPGTVARPLDRVLAWKNDRGRARDEQRHLGVYRSFAAECRGLADLVVIGHVHQPVDEPEWNPRMIVLGGWQHEYSYLLIDEQGAHFHVSPDSRYSIHGHEPGRGS
jgi:UDP-2,3-diacylglucosamine hydrolase